MNSDFDWYFGTDAKPGYYQYDWVSVMIHEVSHGLGFAATIAGDGRFYYVDENGDGWYTDYPNIFTRQLFQGTSGACLTDLSASQRAAVITGDNLYSGRPDGKLLEAHGSRVKMYAPYTWSQGSSVSHWDNSVSFPTFMKYAFSSGDALHTFNTRKIGIFQDIGWKLPEGGPGEGISIIEDVESHTNFTKNSAGSVGWTYYDNGSKTWGIKDVSFPGSGDNFAFIVFNPSATTPPMTDSGITPHSGNKFFACFATSQTKPNNHWIVSPELNALGDFTFSFWAKSYTTEYGAERMKVLYSTSSNAQGSFNNYLDGSTSAHVEVPANWTQYSYTVPSNAKYVAIQCVSNDAFIFMVDDIVIKDNVGIEEKTQTPDGFVIYPNPTRGELIIMVRATSPTTNYELGIRNVEIFDVLGRKAPLNPPKGGRFGVPQTNGFNGCDSSHPPLWGGLGGLDISHLPAGIYFIRIQTEMGVITKKIVKQ
jgi:hypothetical protein